MAKPIKESGLGSFLKSERKKKGMSLEHVAKTTRLRLQYVEALENEEWSKLPSIALIKGFVKIYTKALGIDYNEVMDQFGSSIPVYDELPRPLVPLKKSYSQYFYWCVFVILLLSLFIIFCIVEPLSLFKKADITSTKVREEEAVQQEAYSEADSRDRSSRQGQDVAITPLAESPVVTVKPETAETGVNIQPSVPDETVQKMTARIRVLAPIKETDLKPASDQVAGVHERYILTGYVTSNNWIKIYVDNEDPKDYIFLPGSYPQWRGNEGFYVIVGNAAGVEFDLNGKKIKDLGEEGEVVRLRLPDNFNPDIYE